LIVPVLLIVLALCAQDGEIPAFHTVRLSEPTWLAEAMDAEEIYEHLRQSSAAIPQKYSAEDGVADGHVVVLWGKMQSDPRLADAFLAACRKGRAAEMKFVSFGFEGDVYITSLIFDGKSYYGINDSSRDFWAGFRLDKDYYHEFAFPHLHVFETDEGQSVYLSDDPELTLERLEAKIYGRGSDDPVKYRELYSTFKKLKIVK